MHEYIIFESLAQAQPISNILESKIGLVCCAYYQPVRFAAMKFNNTEQEMGLLSFASWNKKHVLTIGSRVTDIIATVKYIMNILAHLF